MKSILLFNTDTNVRNVFALFNMKIVEVDKANQIQTLGYLLGLDDYTNNNEVNLFPFNESMIIFNEFDEVDLDNALKILKINNIKIDLKAIVTEYNINWKITDLRNELIKEREAIRNAKN